MGLILLAGGASGLGLSWCRAQDPAPKGKEEPAAAKGQDEPAKGQDEAEPKAPRRTYPGPSPIPERPLGPTLPTTVVRRGQSLPNVTMVDAAVLPRERSPELDFLDQTADFTRNEKLTGKKSGATATVVDQIDLGKEGTLTLGKVAGKFQDGEPIVDGKGGTAVARGTVREGIWVLDFAFKPVRLRTVEIQGKGRRQVYYLYYRVINHTGKPRMFVPEFNLVTDTGRRHPDVPLPEGVPVVQTREDPTVPLLGAVSVDGMVPPSTKEGLDDAVFGVAFWIIDPDIARADAFKIFVRGLSDSTREVRTPDGKTITQYKTLRIDFSRFGDERNLKESEIRLLDPPYEWIYW